MKNVFSEGVLGKTPPEPGHHRRAPAPSCFGALQYSSIAAQGRRRLQRMIDGRERARGFSLPFRYARRRYTQCALTTSGVKKKVQKKKMLLSQTIKRVRVTSIHSKFFFFFYDIIYIKKNRTKCIYVCSVQLYCRDRLLQKSFFSSGEKRTTIHRDVINNDCPSSPLYRDAFDVFFFFFL